jgi:hypothetical protein
VVSGRLKVGGAAAPSASATQRVSLDSVPPTVAGFFPANGAQVSTDRPTIGCTLDDGNGTGTDRDTVALLVRGTDVTRAALVAESGVTYYSPAITMGEVAVTVRASDAAGNRAEASWRFTTTAGKMPLGIASISHTPGANATVGSGDKVTVTLRARSKGRSASFDIEGVCTNVTMTKQTADADSDLWTGTYLVKQGDAAQKAKVIGHFVGEKGVRYDLTDDESITIDASARTRLALTAPVAGSKVPDQFEIAGTALAGRTLTWDVTFAGRQPWVGGSSSGSIASGRVKAGADGKWRVTVDASPVRDQVRVVDSFTVTVTRRSGGQVVEQAEITVAPLRP